jgi:hypothetical protein
MRDRKMSKAADMWRKLNGGAIRGEEDHAGIFCCALVVAGELNLPAVAKASGLGMRTTKRLWKRAEEVGLIKNGHIHANWADEDGAMSLVLDSMVLDGTLERVPPVPD